MRIDPKATVFLDASFAIALISSRDRHHRRAIRAATELERARATMVTTEAVLFEIGNALGKRAYRSAAAKLLQSLEQDPLVESVRTSDSLWHETMALFRHRQDKEWGLTDCLSFVVMRRRGIHQALTADRHFLQAGFEALLLP